MNDGRLFSDQILYCEGAPKPYLRGVLHLLCSLILPFGAIDFLRATHGVPIGVLVSIIYLISNLFCYGLSALLHVFKWSLKFEILIQKLDHCGIAIMSTGTIVPVSLLILPLSQGILLLTVTVTACIIVCRDVFALKASVIKQIIVATTVVFFLPWLYYLLTPLELYCVAFCLLSKSIAVFVFINKFPDPFPSIFGYHEVFHVFVVIGGGCIYLCNYSIISRACDELLSLS